MQKDEKGRSPFVFFFFYSFYSFLINPFIDCSTRSFFPINHLFTVPKILIMPRNLPGTGLTKKEVSDFEMIIVHKVLSSKRRNKGRF